MSSKRPVAARFLPAVVALAANVFAVSHNAAAQTPGRIATGPHATLEMIAGDATLAAGRDLWIAARFHLDPGWHVYWVNPGDSGGPPTFDWTAPAGFTVDDITWPTPERLPLGPLVNYGYEGDVVLPMRVRVPASYDDRTPVTLAARARWLVCKDLCVPGRGQVALALPLSGAERGNVAEWSRAIAAARDKAPSPAPRAWKASAISRRDDFVLTIEMDRPAVRAVFFPLDPSQVDDSAEQRAQVSGRRLTLGLRKSSQLTGVPPALRGVLALSPSEAFVVEAPVRSDSSQQRE
jgi:DsbC/DsbD-like thiol-disulfide interchange protein